MSLSLNALTAETGTLFVISSGNEGNVETVLAPGSADAALTVASVTKGDALSWFTSRGRPVGNRRVIRGKVVPLACGAPEAPSASNGSHDVGRQPRVGWRRRDIYRVFG
ncbi:S8 family serine peptidase [Phytomonospora sp. NPDC050363]|uniref:S8 family serine peptidase n=1 Tax=Phytomonospora sp. NPDC050363 TaxID=3155642 RepID=UPI0033CA7A81